MPANGRRRCRSTCRSTSRTVQSAHPGGGRVRIAVVVAADAGTLGRHPPEGTPVGRSRRRRRRRRGQRRRRAGGDHRRGRGHRGDRPRLQRGGPLRWLRRHVAGRSRFTCGPRDGHQTTIPVGELSPGWVAGTVEAKVMDDEGFGLRRLDRLPLDRRGATFKLDSGTIAFDFAGATLAGPTMNIQTGYFFTRKLGLLANLGLGGGAAAGGARAAACARSRAAGVPAGVGPGPPRRVRQRRNGHHRGARRVDPDLRQRPFRRRRRARRAGSDVAPRAHAARGGSLAKLDQIWTPAGQLTAGVAVY